MFESDMVYQQEETRVQDVALSKRRRFAPESLPVIMHEDGTTTPLLLEAGDRSQSQQEIEAQLLQVGMKIQKPVNEVPGRRAFTPRPFANYSRLSAETLSALSNKSGADGMCSSGAQNLSTATFCGINLAMMSHVNCTPAIQDQKLWSYSTASKRRQQFDEDSDSDESQEFMPQTPQLEYADGENAPVPQDYFNITSFDVAEFSTSTQTRTVQGKHNRKIAQPRSRIRVQQEPVPMFNPFAQIAPRPTGFGGHHRMRSCGMEAMDFGEASFLQSRTDTEMDCS